MQIGSLVIFEKPHETVTRLSEWGNKTPVLLETYTVRSVKEVNGEPCIQLEELVNSPQQFQQGFLECCFLQRLFRELQPPIPNVEQWVNDNTLELVEVNPKQ